jgi:hypothetical protein
VQGSVSDVIKTVRQDSAHPLVTTTQKHTVATKYPSLISRSVQVVTHNKIHPIHTSVIIKIKKEILTYYILSVPPYPVLPIKSPIHIKQSDFNQTNK